MDRPIHSKPKLTQNPDHTPTAAALHSSQAKTPQGVPISQTLPTPQDDKVIGARDHEHPKIHVPRNEDVDSSSSPLRNQSRSNESL